MQHHRPISFIGDFFKTLTISKGPRPFLMALSILSFGMFSAFALATASRSLEFASGSPPLILTAVVISLMSFVNIWPLFASAAPFLFNGTPFAMS